MRRESIERLLPPAYQRAATPASPLTALLDVMEALHAPSEERLATTADLFAPYRTPDMFVAFLARWVALGDHLIDPAVPVGRLRDLVARAAELAQWRGTATGLRTVIELATGLSGVDVSEPEARPFHVLVRLPANGAAHLELVRRVVSAEKPAATTCDVVVDRPTTTEEGASQ
jgi:phage tail-like protein